MKYSHLPDFTSLSWKAWILRCLIIFTITSGFTVFCVSTSEKIGRLSTVPYYDDCVYIHTAEVRNFLWQRGGITAVWDSIRNERPIHSPYSELLATGAFLLFGHNDRAPYLANGIVIFTYLGILTWLLRGMALVPWITSLFVFLSLPIAKMGVVEFRPDIFWGICIAFGAIYVLTTPNLLKEVEKLFFSGLIFSAAYLAKPTTFALTTLVLGASFGGRLLYAWNARREQETTLREAIRSILIISCTLATFIGWYYLFFGRHVWDYFYQNAFGPNKEFWTFKGNWLALMLYYINGNGGNSSLGTLGLITTLIMLVLLIWRIVVASHTEKLRLFIIMGIGTLIYIVITIGGMENRFFGASLHMFAIFTTAYLLNWLYSQPPLFSKGFITGSLIIFAVITAFFFQTWPPASDWNNKLIKRDTSREATNALIDTLQSMEPIPKSILVVQMGPVIPEAVGIGMLRKHHNIDVSTASFYRTMDEFHNSKKNKDMIVISDLDSKGTINWLPIKNLMPNIFQEITSDPEFSFYQTIQTPAGAIVHVYIRKEILSEKMASQKL